MGYNLVRVVASGVVNVATCAQRIASAMPKVWAREKLAHDDAWV